MGKSKKITKKNLEDNGWVKGIAAWYWKSSNQQGDKPHLHLFQVNMVNDLVEIDKIMWTTDTGQGNFEITFTPEKGFDANDLRFAPHKNDYQGAITTLNENLIDVDA